MFGRLRHLIPATTVYFGVAAVVWAGSGYLPVVGPVPLRFRPLPDALAVSTNAPAPPPAPPQTNATDLDPPPPIVVPKAAEPYTAEAQSPAPQPSVPADPVVSPEMLVKYFAQPGSTNSANPNGLSPQVGFTPPLLEAKPQSHDTP